MKKLIIPMVMLFLAACSVVPNFYQIYKTNPEEGGILTNNKIIFEDKNCLVTYNLWAEGGNIGFNIYNKTTSDLTVDLTKTFFVLNDVAFEYFQNRTFSKSSNSGTIINPYRYPNHWNYNPAITGTTSFGISTSYIEKPILRIPSKTLINVSEYNVINTRYIHCDLLKYPSRKKIKTLYFDKNNSPFIFYNLITYSTSTDTLRLENKFYVSEITNYPEDEIFTEIDTSACGGKLDYSKEVFKNVSPDKFYFKYSTE